LHFGAIKIYKQGNKINFQRRMEKFFFATPFLIIQDLERESAMFI